MYCDTGDHSAQIAGYTLEMDILMDVQSVILFLEKCMI